MTERAHHPSPSYLMAQLLIWQLFLCYLLADLGLPAGLPPSPFLFPVALLLPPTLLFITTATRRETIIRTTTREAIKTGIGSWILWGAAIATALIFTDYSYDGNAYHQEIIAALCNGWVPGEPNPSGLPLSVWTLHYAKGIEIEAVTVVSCLGRMEAGKCVNIILCLVAGFLCYSFTQLHFPSLGKWRKLLIAVSAVINPVSLLQSTTYYIDFSKYVYTLCAIIFLIELLSSPDKEGQKRGLCPALMLGIVIILAAATKFNAFFEVGVTAGAAIIWLLWQHRYKGAWRLALLCVGYAALAVLIFNWHPYITNWLTAGHPLYPLMGEGAVDIMTGNTPDCFINGNRFSNFFLSLISAETLSADTRQGGFGIFMAPLLILALLSIWAGRKVRPGGKGALYIAGWLLASCFIFEQSWWARYVAQLWILIPEGLLIASLTADRTESLSSRKWMNTTVVITSILLLGSTLFCLRNVLVLGARATLYRHTLAETLRGRRVRVRGLNESYRRQLTEMGAIPLNGDSVSPDRHSVPLFGTLAKPDAYPILLLDSIEGSEIRKNLTRLPFNYSPSFETDPRKLPK